MTLVDTHCHLTDAAFRDDLGAVVERARQASVSRIVLACVDTEDFADIERLCRQAPDLCIPAFGIHPENMAPDLDAQIAAAARLLDSRPAIRAIGEVGLDLHWDSRRRDDQLRLLLTQMRWAIDRRLPLLLHVRDAMPDFLALLPDIKRYADERDTRLRGVMHCFSGTADEARAILQYGDFFFGIGGTLTYRKSRVPQVAQALGVERIVVETDAPYLAPVPHRGHRNEPAFVADTARCLAEVLALPIETVARVTTENARILLDAP